MTPITTTTQLEALPAETLLRGGQPGYGPAYVLIWDAGDGRLLYSDCTERGYLAPAEVIRIHAPLAVVQSPDPSPTVLALAQALAEIEGEGAAFTSTTKSESSARVVNWCIGKAERIAAHLPAPTVKPGREALAEVVGEHQWAGTVGRSHDDPGGIRWSCTCGHESSIDGMSGHSSWLAAHATHAADAVLAIPPGKTEAQVRAEALRDAQQVIAGEDSIAWARTASGSHIMLDHAIGMIDDLIADEEAGK